MMIPVQSIKMGTVVKSTSTEKRKVQMGSAICHSGFTLIIIAAAMTPTLWTMSPRMWTIAALMLRFFSVALLVLFSWFGSMFPSTSFSLKELYYSTLNSLSFSFDSMSSLIVSSPPLEAKLGLVATLGLTLNAFSSTLFFLVLSTLSSLCEHCDLFIDLF